MPIWFAITLRKRLKCTIRTPDWLNLEELQSVLRYEKTQEDFYELPYHYIEIGSMLLDAASEDIENVDTVRSTLEDIQNVRMAKIRKGFQDIARMVREDEEKVTSVNLKGMAAFEIFQIRPFMTSMLNQFYSLSTEASDLSKTGGDGRRQRKRQTSLSSSAAASSSSQRSARPS